MPISQKTLTASFIIFLSVFLKTSPAISQAVSIQISGNQRCITSNGIPDHETGKFPNQGNPHSIKTQSIKFCVPLKPQLGSRAVTVSTVGIALNGIIIRPGTADWYDPTSPRGHSRDSRSGWNLEGIGARDTLGIDQQNAHVDQRGIYHYHGMPPALIPENSTTLIGYAADGFEIHYSSNQQATSYQLKTGNRPTAPKGQYDGTYNQDWKYVPGSSRLDECNGAMLDGKYVYFATRSYPFFPRCLKGRTITYLDGKRQTKPPRKKRGNR